MEEQYIALDETFLRRFTSFGSYDVDTLPGSCAYLQNIVPYSMATVLHRRCDLNPNSLQEHQMGNIRYVSLVKDLPPDHFAYTIISHSAECKKFIQFKNLECVYMTITDRKTNEEVEKYEWNFQFVDYEDEQLEAMVRELSLLTARQRFHEFFEGILKIPNTSRHNENDIIIKCGMYLNAGIPQYLRGIASPIPPGERKKRYTGAPIKVAKIQTKYHTVELSYSMQQCNDPTTSSPIIREVVEDDKIKHSLATSTPCVPARGSSCSGRSRFDPVISPLHYEHFRDVVQKGSMATKKRCKRKTASPVNKESPTILRRALMATGVSPIQTNRSRCNPQNNGLKYTSVVVKPRDSLLAVKNLQPAEEHAITVLPFNMKAKKRRRINTEIMQTDAQTLPDQTHMSFSTSCVFAGAVQKASEKVTNTALSSPKSANNDSSSNINKEISVITATNSEMQPEQTQTLQTLMKYDKNTSITAIHSNPSKRFTQVNTFSDRPTTQKEPRQICNMPQIFSHKKQPMNTEPEINADVAPPSLQPTINNDTTGQSMALNNPLNIPENYQGDKRNTSGDVLQNSSFETNVEDGHSTYTSSVSSYAAAIQKASKVADAALPSPKSAGNDESKGINKKFSKSNDTNKNNQQIHKGILCRTNSTRKQSAFQNSSFLTETSTIKKLDTNCFTSCVSAEAATVKTASEKVAAAALPSPKSAGSATSNGIEKQISNCIPTHKVLKRKMGTLGQLPTDVDNVSTNTDKRPELEASKKNDQQIPKGIEANLIHKQFVSQNSSLEIETSTVRKVDIESNSSFTLCRSLTDTASEKFTGASPPSPSSAGNATSKGIKTKISKCIPTPKVLKRKIGITSQLPSDIDDNKSTKTDKRPDLEPTRKNDQQIPKGILRQANPIRKQSVAENLSFETETSSLRRFEVDCNSTFTSCGSLIERPSEEVALPSPKSAGNATSKGIKTNISKCMPTPKVLKRKIRTMKQLQSDIDEYESRIADKRPEFEHTKKNKQENPKGILRQANPIRKQSVSENSSFEIEPSTLRRFDIDGNTTFTSCGSLTERASEKVADTALPSPKSAGSTTSKGIKTKISKCVPTPRVLKRKMGTLAQLPTDVDNVSTNTDKIPEVETDCESSTLRKFDIDGNSFTSCDSANAQPGQKAEKVYAAVECGHTELDSMPFYTAQEEFSSGAKTDLSMRSVGDLSFGSKFGSDSESNIIRANKRMTATQGIMEPTFERRPSPLSSLDHYAISQGTTTESSN